METRLVRTALRSVLTAVICVWVPSVAKAGPVSSGTATIPGTWTFDFDTGGIGGIAGADIFWKMETGTSRELIPTSSPLWYPFPPTSAEIVNLGSVDFAAVTFAQLQGLNYGVAPIDGSDVGGLLVPGDVFAVKTDQGNFAKVLVTGPLDQTQNNGLPIQWVTENQANQESDVLPAPAIFPASLIALAGVAWLRRRRIGTVFGRDVP